MLQANLNVAESMRASVSTFMAYLMLAHIPQTKEKLVTAIDVHSAALQGMAQASVIGLDDIEYLTSQSGFDWEMKTESVQWIAAVSNSGFPSRI